MLTIVAKLYLDAVILGHTADTPNPESYAAVFQAVEKTPTPFQLRAYVLSVNKHTPLKVAAHRALVLLTSPRYS